MSPLYTFSIVTTAARSDMEWLHDRTPLIFASDTKTGREAISLWLDHTVGWTLEVQKLLQPFQGALTIYQGKCIEVFVRDAIHAQLEKLVPQEVGRVGEQSPTFIQPVAERKDGIKAMFAKRQNVKKEQTDDSPAEQDSSVTPDCGNGPSLKRLRSESSDIVETTRPSLKRLKLDITPPPQPSSSSAKKETIPTKSPKKAAPKSPSKGKAKGPPPGNQSITNFFSVSPRKAPK